MINIQEGEERNANSAEPEEVKSELEKQTEILKKKVKQHRQPPEVVDLPSGSKASEPLEPLQKFEISEATKARKKEITPNK